MHRLRHVKGKFFQIILRNIFHIQGPPVTTNTVIYEALEWQHPFWFLCYRIVFGGNPVHPIIMAHVLDRISIEISMCPGVVSTCLLDELMGVGVGGKRGEKQGMR